uniref:Prediced GPI-anchored protein 23-like n=1 Tax=Nicotiana sylvestris TaxID=4096 RepID=A0A1U7WVV6_NICSY|nr:PREDICTED: prediced GPI-anchored protein 23-like [Nicotiana sylvestris]
MVGTAGGSSTTARVGALAAPRARPRPLPWPRPLKAAIGGAARSGSSDWPAGAIGAASAAGSAGAGGSNSISMSNGRSPAASILFSKSFFNISSTAGGTWGAGMDNSATTVLDMSDNFAIVEEEPVIGAVEGPEEGGGGIATALSEGSAEVDGTSTVSIAIPAGSSN